MASTYNRWSSYIIITASSYISIELVFLEIWKGGWGIDPPEKAILKKPSLVRVKKVIFCSFAKHTSNNIVPFLPCQDRRHHFKCYLSVAYKIQTRRWYHKENPLQRFDWKLFQPRKWLLHIRCSYSMFL